MFLTRKKEYQEKKGPEMIEVEETKEKDKSAESSGIHYVRDDLDENDDNDIGNFRSLILLIIFHTH